MGTSKHRHHDHENHANGAAKDAPTTYACPMHPEVQQDTPGKCPTCGMFLVPEGQASADDHAARGHSGHAHHDHAGHEHQGLAASPRARTGTGGTYDKVPADWTGAVYTCPMHPEVRQTTPGACPLCGMGLQIEAGAAAHEEGPNPELVDFTRRLWIAAILTVPLLVLTMSPFLGITAVRDLFGEHRAMWVEFGLATPVVLWSGWPFFERGWTSFRTWNLNMFSLIGMGIAAAYVYSVVALLAPGIFPVGFRDPQTGTVGVYFEAAAVIVTLVLLGQVMELRAREGTGKAI